MVLCQADDLCIRQRRWISGGGGHFATVAVRLVLEFEGGSRLRQGNEKFACLYLFCAGTQNIILV